jgi:predicted dienelactone hydrolase
MFVFIFLLSSAIIQAEAPPYRPDASRCDFASVEDTWHDGDRDRDVPAKIYYPVDTKGLLPVIIFSHGLGGSCEGYGYLGEYWAAHGYVAVHLTHAGSDTAAVMENGVDKVKETAAAIAAKPKNAVDRCKDVSFAIDQLKDQVNSDKESPLAGRLDMDRIAVAGHSFGANTAMLIAGEMTRSGKTVFADKRVKCALAMSPPIATPERMWDKAYSTVKIPLFVMTGTLDDSPIGQSKAADRRVPFDHVKDIPAYLLTFTGGDHMLFSGREAGARPGTDERYHRLILLGSTVFFDAYLRGDESAKKWLSGGDYKTLVGDAGKFEERKPD